MKKNSRFMKLFAALALTLAVLLSTDVFCRYDNIIDCSITANARTIDIHESGVNNRPLINISITSAKSFTYDGTQKKVTVQVRDSFGITSDYTIKGNTGTNVGTYTVTASSAVNSVSTTWTITKASNTLTYTSAQSVTKTFSTDKQTATLSAATKAQGALSYTISSQKTSSGAAVSYFTLSGTTLTISAGTPAGTYKVAVKAAAAGSSNYYSATKTSTVTVIVNKANITPSVTMDGWTYGDTPNDPIVSGNTGEGDVTYEYKVSTADDSTYTNTKPSDAGTYTVRATVDATANYNGGSATTDFTISPAVVEGNTKPSLVNFTLDGIIGANFYYPSDLDNRITKISFSITNNTTGNETKTIDVDRTITTDVNGTTYLKVTCPITVDKLYGGKITATALTDETNTIGQSRTLNIDKYILSVNGGNYDDTMKAVVNTMQQYSRYAQEYINEDTLTTLATADSDKLAIAQAALEHEYIPSQLILGDAVTMRIYVGSSEPTVSDTATYFKKKYTLTTGSNENGYYIDVENVPAFAMLHGFKLNYTVDGESQSITYYPITYLARLVDASNNLDEYTQNIACALYEYAVAVDTQFFNDNVA